MILRNPGGSYLKILSYIYKDPFPKWNSHGFQGFDAGMSFLEATIQPTTPAFHI